MRSLKALLAAALRGLATRGPTSHTAGSDAKVDESVDVSSSASLEPYPLRSAFARLNAGSAADSLASDILSSRLGIASVPNAGTEDPAGVLSPHPGSTPSRPEDSEAPSDGPPDTEIESA